MFFPRLESDGKCCGFREFKIIGFPFKSIYLINASFQSLIEVLWIPLFNLILQTHTVPGYTAIIHCNIAGIDRHSPNTHSQSISCPRCQLWQNMFSNSLRKTLWIWQNRCLNQIWLNLWLTDWEWGNHGPSAASSL